MDITAYLEEFARKKRAPSAIYDMKTARNLLVGDGEAALKQQEAYEDSEYLAYNIKQSVRAYARNKDVAIRIYKDFLAFLRAFLDKKRRPCIVSKAFYFLRFFPVFS